MPKSDRLLDLLHWIGPRSRTLREIASRMAISERTAYRDLADLSRIAPVARDDHGYRLLSTATLRPLNLTSEEHAVLKLALQNPSLRRTPVLRRRLERLEAKLDAAMAHIEETPTALRLAGPTRSGPATGAALELLERAIAERQRVEMVYTSLSHATGRGVRRPERRMLDPWQLFERGSVWYVVGHCHKNAAPRMFRLDRIAAIFPTHATFEIPRDFDLDATLADAWTVWVGAETHDITLHLSPSLAPLILNAEHHPGETKRVLRGGKVEYRVRLSSLDEIGRWVVGFGGGVRVVEPGELRERVRGIAKGALGE